MITAVFFLFVKMLKPYKCPLNGRMKKYILLHLHNAISQSCQYEWTGDNSVMYIYLKAQNWTKEQVALYIYIIYIHMW